MGFGSRSVCILSVSLLLLSCKGNDDEGAVDNPSPPISVKIVNAFPGLGFNKPFDLQSPKDGTDRIFVVEQSGLIKVFPNQPDIGESTFFLDIENKVDDTEGEMGLLGLAFHPEHGSNGYFYVYYNTSRITTVVSRFKVSDTDADSADPNSEVLLLQIAQPFTNHNGGQLAFGPDGFLYIAIGDGGSGGDPQGNAQNRTNLLGTILRIDVDKAENGLNYGIPIDNPFVDSTDFRREIFASGLRNPWRISFDVQTGLLWAGDVGQGKIEEIDVIEKGGNYGWNLLEGTDCFLGNGCNTPDLAPPVFEYTHDKGDLSVTGGYVYRGNKVAQLQGRYVYADFVSGRIWTLGTDLNATPNNELLMDSGLNISSFGTDENNELFICSFDGSIYRFEDE